MMHSGMMQDGVKSSEVIAYLTLMGESTEDILWLTNHVKASAEARKATQ
tara:strand:+ start:144 stop:290 length:147 start_codon:yes stop_codon:yes gene_type:complete